MKKLSINLILIASCNLMGCALLPAGENCTKNIFPEYFDCYQLINAQKTQAYEALIFYGQSLSSDVRNGVLSNESAFRLFSLRRQSVQDQLVEAQARALSNALRRSSSDK